MRLMKERRVQVEREQDQLNFNDDTDNDFVPKFYQVDTQTENCIVDPPSLIKLKSFSCQDLNKDHKKSNKDSKLSKTNDKTLEFISITPQDSEFRKRTFK